MALNTESSIDALRAVTVDLQLNCPLIKNKTTAYSSPVSNMTTNCKLRSFSAMIIPLLLLIVAHSVTNALSSLKMSSTAGTKNVLIIGGSRFSGLYLWKELHDRGHQVTLYNRGKTALKKLPSETEESFADRQSKTKYIKGDRTNADELRAKLGSETFDVIYDMNGREVADTAPLADLFNGKVEHFVYMSSAGVYKKSDQMPHIEGDTEDDKSRHKGKLETESYLRKIGIPFTSIRPTYIYGPGNYNPLEEWYFSRIQAGRRLCIPGHGQHLTGLGHVADLASAMAQVIGRDHCKGQVYNVQDQQAVSFESLGFLCAEAMGKDPKDPESLNIKYYDKSAFDFGDKKAFPMREQHFFCSIDQAMKDLDWAPKYNMLDGLKDSYHNDFKVRLKAGETWDFSTDDMVLADDRIAVKMYSAMPRDVL